MEPLPWSGTSKMTPPQVRETCKARVPNGWEFVDYMIFFLTDKFDVKKLLRPLVEREEFHSLEEQETA